MKTLRTKAAKTALKVNAVQTLLSISQDSKTVKGEIFGYLTAIVYMAASDMSGEIDVCPHASPECRKLCLVTSGMAGVFKSINEARIKKTLFFARDRKGFLAQLTTELAAFIAKAHKLGLTPAIRLNGTSDLSYESWGVMKAFPTVQFYDYTKNPARMQRYLAGKMPSNYHLTFSLSETEKSRTVAFDVLNAGGNVAVVFSGKILPETFWGFPVINGDESDLRFLDKRGVVVGLIAKGKARGAQPGFVVDASAAR